ncbi:MAG: ABC transporter ATP-binding protein [Bacillota bacterium]|jgi:branched-chain amino acid transport system ATP-binding protein
MNNFILQGKGLTKKFGGVTAVNQVDFQVKENEVLGIIGPNGAGKTTLINMISRSMPITSGELYFEDKNISNLNCCQVGQLGVARTFQIVKPFKNMKVIENATVGALFGNSNKPLKEAKEWAEEVLNFVGLYNKKDAYGDELTLGQVKRLELARALAMKPKIMLLDEVMAGLNHSEINDALAIIEKLRAKGITLLVVEHLMKVIMTISERILVMHYGAKIADGTPKEVVSDQQVIEAYLGKKFAEKRGNLINAF